MVSPDTYYRRGFLRAIRMIREAVQANKHLPQLDRIRLLNDLALLEKKAATPMLTEMQGPI